MLADCEEPTILYHGGTHMIDKDLFELAQTAIRAAVSEAIEKTREYDKTRNDCECCKYFNEAENLCGADGTSIEEHVQPIKKCCSYEVLTTEQQIEKFKKLMEEHI